MTRPGKAGLWAGILVVAATEACAPQAPPRPQPPPTGVLYHDEPTAPSAPWALWRRPIPDGQPTVVLHGKPGGALGVSPTHRGTFVAFIEDRRPELETELVDPYATLYGPDGQVVADLGAGVTGVMVSRDARHLAFTRAEAPPACDPEDAPQTCPPRPLRLFVAPLTRPAAARDLGLLESRSGFWWTPGGGLLVVTGAGEALHVEASGRRQRVTLGAPRLLDAEEASGRLLVADAELHRLQVRTLGGRRLWEGSFAPWRASGRLAPGGRWLVVEAARPRPDGLGADKRLSLVEVDSGRQVDLGERSSDGALTWTVDGSWFSYRRTVPGGFQLVICPLARPRRCVEGFRWEGGIAIDALEG